MSPRLLFIFSILAATYQIGDSLSAQFKGTCDNYIDFIQVSRAGDDNWETVSGISGDLRNWGAVKEGTIDNIGPNTKIKISCSNDGNDGGAGGFIFTVGIEDSNGDVQWYSTDGSNNNNGFYKLLSSAAGKTEVRKPDENIWGMTTLYGAPYNAHFTWGCDGGNSWCGGFKGEKEVYLFEASSPGIDIPGSLSAQFKGTCDNYIDFIQVSRAGDNNWETVTDVNGDMRNWGVVKEGTIGGIGPKTKIKVSCSNDANDGGAGGFIFTIGIKDSDDNVKWYSTDGSNNNNGFYQLLSSAAGKTEVKKPDENIWGMATLRAAPYNAHFTWGCDGGDDWCGGFKGEKEVYLFDASFPGVDIPGSCDEEECQDDSFCNGREYCNDNDECVPGEAVVCPRNTKCDDTQKTCLRVCSSFAIDEYLDQCSDEFQANEDRVDGIEETISSMQTDFGGLQTNVNNINTKIDGIETNINTMNSAINSINTEIELLKDTFKGFEPYEAAQKAFVNTDNQPNVSTWSSYKDEIIIGLILMNLVFVISSFYNCGKQKIVRRNKRSRVYGFDQDSSNDEQSPLK